MKNGLDDFNSWHCYWLSVWYGGFKHVYRIERKRKEKIMETYITLIYLTVGAFVFVVWLLKNYFSHEKKFFHSFDEPLDNKGKWWYN